MTQPRPTYCAFGETGHLAVYRVKSGHREAVTCQTHLAKAKRWAGAHATSEALDGHDPPPEQPALF